MFISLYLFLFFLPFVPVIERQRYGKRGRGNQFSPREGRCHKLGSKALNENSCNCWIMSLIHPRPPRMQIDSSPSHSPQRRGPEPPSWCLLLTSSTPRPLLPLRCAARCYFLITVRLTPASSLPALWAALPRRRTMNPIRNKTK